MENNGKAQPVYVSSFFYDILTAVYTIQEKVLLGGEDPAPLLAAAQTEIQAKMDGAP
jgi:hypothetical protein